jgi:hypothetical protein
MLLTRAIHVAEVGHMFIVPARASRRMPPLSSSLAAEKRVRSLLLTTAARDYRRSQAASLFGSAQIVGARGSHSSGSSGGLSTELATSTNARDSTDSAIAVMVSRT